MTSAMCASKWEVIRTYEETFASAAGVRNAADAALVDLVVQAREEGLWEGWRIHSPTQWLMWRAGVSRSTARRMVGLARRASELPTVMAAFRRGGLSLDQAAAVARYTPAAYEASVCELAVNATVHQIVAATRQYGFDAEVADRDERAPRGPQRSISFGTDGADQWRACIRLPADEGQIVEAALEASREHLHEARRAAAKTAADAQGRPATGTDRDLGIEPVSWADAFMGVARCASSTAGRGGDVANRAAVLIHLKAPVDGADAWVAEMHQGPALPPAMRRYLTCDGTIAPVWHEDGLPVQVGRTQHIVPKRTRRLVEHRDGGCRVPACDNHLWTQIHHIVHWEDHGLTETWNLICLCTHHHRMHHQGHLGITGNADQPNGVVFTTATGRTLEPPGPPPPPHPEQMPKSTPTTGRAARPSTSTGSPSPGSAPAPTRAGDSPPPDRRPTERRPSATPSTRSRMAPAPGRRCYQ